MDSLSNISTVKQLLEKHGFKFSKSLGQNFLINPTVCPRMAQLSGAGSGVCALEIGPGVGVLTCELARLADRVVAVELDKRLIPVLSESLAEFDNVKIVQGDVMKLDLNKLIRDEFGTSKAVICANLPYYITSPVIMRLLEERLPVASITVMVQKEAALRLCAPMGTRKCGAVTAAVSYRAVASRLFEVSAGSFLPSPKVDSEVIRLDVLDKPPVAVLDESFFFRVIRGSFSQRRKTLPNALSSALGCEKSVIAQALVECGIQQTARAEELTLELFAAVANSLFDMVRESGL